MSKKNESYFSTIKQSEWGGVCNKIEFRPHQSNIHCLNKSQK